MRSFTTNDFITYNNPCFSCGDKINFRIGSVHLGVNKESPDYLSSQVINNHTTAVNLTITYNSQLNLNINHKSNKIGSNNPIWLKQYLKDHKLFLSSICSKCYTTIESTYLDFDLNRGFVTPTHISNEMLMLKDDKNMYKIKTSFMEEKTVIIVDSLNKMHPISPVKLVLPLLPLYKFKTRERILNKIKTYLIFS